MKQRTVSGPQAPHQGATTISIGCAPTSIGAAALLLAGLRPGLHQAGPRPRVASSRHTPKWHS
jgi:hypothetical protein